MLPTTTNATDYDKSACAGLWLMWTRSVPQGFWPDGLYTPPTQEAWVADIQMAKRLGYNTLRKHVKVEPEQCAPAVLRPCLAA